MPARPDPQRLEAWRAFLRAHAVLTDTLDRELQAERDLPLAWYDVLLNLAESGDHRLRMRDLADRVMLSRSGLTRLVDRMATAGLVSRQPDPDDRRGTLACLTDTGLQTLRRAAPVHLRGVQEHFASHLRDDEVDVVRAALQRVSAPPTRQDRPSAAR
jgi:DNA-binding MarR family transcriptional regulator